MKEIQYVAKDDLNLGRFGMITKGKKLTMTEMEYEGIANDKRFKLLTETPSEDESKVAAKVLPWGTGLFDLRSVPWERQHLPRQLLARSSRKKLMELLNAMVEVGAKVRKFETTEQRVWLVDRVIEAARYHGWTEIPVEDRLKLPMFTDRETSKPKPPISKPQPKDQSSGGRRRKKPARTRSRSKRKT